jgi:hypothetical protein
MPESMLKHLLAVELRAEEKIGVPDRAWPGARLTRLGTGHGHDGRKAVFQLKRRGI